MNGLDLFSGIGGISLGLKDYVRPVAYCEIDPYCQGVLLSRMVSEDLRSAPIWDNIKTLSKSDLPGIIDIIYGGFPCQDISIAGNGKGLAGERSGLFFEMVRLAKEIKPCFIFLENVPAITSRGGLQVVREITEMGYDCRWCVISAASVGALHRRERWFFLANSNSERCNKEQWGQPCGLQKTYPQSSGSSQPERENPWKIEPDVGRVADGISDRVDKLRALGNSVVPQQVKKAFEILMGINF